MKPKKLIILEKILRFMAVWVLKRHKPKIVAITGSVGKTTTKEVIWTVLSNYYNTRKNEKNYNNEIGVPLTIIGISAPKRSILFWLGVFVKWLGVMILPLKYPQILILEMGADRPGDIKYLTGFVPVDVGVLTNVGISHLEHFRSKKELASEKGKILKTIAGNGLAVFNFDNKESRQIGENVRANTIAYGFDRKAAMRASDIIFNYERSSIGPGRSVSLLKGISFKLNYDGKIIPVRLNYCLGRPHIYAVLAAFAVGTYFNLNLLDVAGKVQGFRPYPGRMSLLEGIKGTVIIDDTYNSVLDSLLAALESFNKIKAARKIVVLGDMLELGDEEESAHQLAGREVFNSGVDLFISVGKRMHWAAREFARLSGASDKVIEFDNPKDAGLYAQKIIRPGDLILVKGSQGMRMEKIVEEIMRHPGKKEELLVRQSKIWKEKEFVQP